jgi:hypothetical protein
MANLILRLRVDPATGRREVVIDYTSEADALPMEHEEEHRRLAAGVIDGGLGAGGVTVSREAEPGHAGEEPAERAQTPAGERAAQRRGE